MSEAGLCLGLLYFPSEKILLWNIGPQEHGSGWTLFFNALCPASHCLCLSVFLSFSLFQENTVTDMDPPPRGVIYYVIFPATI